MWLRRGDIGIRFGSAWAGLVLWLPRRRTCPAGHGCVQRSRAGNGGRQTGGQRIEELHISPLESYIQIWCTEDLNITLISS